MAEDLVELQDNGIYKVFNDVGLEHLLNEQHKTITRLEKENEQLKKENEKLDSMWEDKCIKEYMNIVGENALQEMHNEKYGDKRND